MVPGDKHWVTYDNLKRIRLWVKHGVAAQTGNRSILFISSCQLAIDLAGKILTSKEAYENRLSHLLIKTALI